VFSGKLQEDLFPYGKADGAHTWHEGDDGNLTASTALYGLSDLICTLSVV
jgi:hypothetical protein